MKVLVVDDSPTVRAVLAQLLGAAGVEVLQAGDGLEGVELARSGSPDVVLMDLHLPKLGGVEAIGRIMRWSPRPIVVLSGQLGRRDVDLTFEALEAGALEVIAKPDGAAFRGPEFGRTLVRTLRLMARVQVVTRHHSRRVSPQLRVPPPPRREIPTLQDASVLLIGASTGGPPVLFQLLSAIRSPCRVPIVVAQHIATGFDRGLATWLGSTGHDVALLDRPQALEPGVVYVGSADAGPIVRAGGLLDVEVELAPHRAQIRPNVDVLFESAAAHLGPTVCAVLLSGMGRDGARGLRAIRDAGGHTFAQDEESCVVFGMPAAALEEQAVDELHSPAALGSLLAAVFGGT